jgi:hypothetical protein
MIGVGLLATQACTGSDYAGEDVGAQQSASTRSKGGGSGGSSSGSGGSGSGSTTSTGGTTSGSNGAGTNAACRSQQGVFPTKAALAVAMGIELGRWDPVNDLVISNPGTASAKATLKSGVNCIKNSCKQTKALLGQTDFTVDTTNFNATSYQSDLVASFDRQTNLISNLTLNHPASMPPAHKLTLVGGPVNLGTATCGPHYVFQVDNPDGSALTSAQAANLSNTLCYFGQDSPYMGCGGNPFVGFATTGNSCPSGRVCVAIDPDDGDAGTTTTTTAGALPMYTLNRLWDPANTQLNAACQRTTGAVGVMTSRCSTYPSTCGYLYCM